MVGGRVLMENGVIQSLDEQYIMAKSRELATQLWKRF